MSTSGTPLLGRVAIAAKLITMEQLAEATRVQSRMSSPPELGEMLVELGYLTPEGLEKVLALQKSVLERARKQRAARDGAPPETKAEPEIAPDPGPAGTPPASGPGHDAGIPGFEPTTLGGEAPQLSRVVEPSFEALEGSGDKALTPAAGEELGVETDAAAAEQIAGATAATRPSPTGPLNPPCSPEMEQVLRDSAARGASDVHLHSRAPLRFRLRGRLVNQGDEILSPEQTEAMALSLLSPAERAIFEEHGEVDFSYSLDGVGRFRTNLYRQLRGVDVTLRRIPLEPPTLEDLGLPHDLAKFTNFHQGMVLITGPTRCGKSSTMAALVGLINEERSEHILTIEDPIEYVHRSNRCLVNQRNVGRHTETFSRALRAALREDPDVIVIGELRDRETISLALTAAETGHFVLATLHTDNAIRTVDRIIGSFPADQQEQVRMMISESLRAVISQRLLPRADDKGMAAALEVMVVNRAVGNLIRESKIVQIRSLLQTGQKQGMRLLDASLAELVSKAVVTREEALRHAEDPKVIPG